MDAPTWMGSFPSGHIEGKIAIFLLIQAMVERLRALDTVILENQPVSDRDSLDLDMEHLTRIGIGPIVYVKAPKNA